MIDFSVSCQCPIWGEKQPHECYLQQLFKTPAHKAGVRILVSLLEGGVSNRQPQVAHIKWENQEAAANMSDLVAYIFFLLYTERKMMVLVNLKILLCLIIHICINNRWKLLTAKKLSLLNVHLAC